MSSRKVTRFEAVGLGFFFRRENYQVLRPDIFRPVTVCAVVFPRILLVLMPVRARHELGLEAVLAVDAAQGQRL